MTMADDNFFLIFSEAEAPDPLRLSLQYFFEKEQYRYKFSNAFTKFTKIINEELITARRFFNIVKETSLISDKLVIRHHTTSGWTYSFEKGFFRNAERYHRRINRVGNDLILHTIDDAVEETKSTTFSQKSTNTPTSLPITQDDTSSIENLSVADTWEQTNTITAHSRRDSSPTSPLSNSANNTTVDVSMKSEIRNITDTMNDDINKVMADLQDSPQSFTRPLQATIREFITNEIANSFTNLTGFKTASDITTKLDQVTVLERDLRIRKENFNQVEIQYKKSIEKMESRFHFLTNKVDKFESQLQNKLDTVTSQTTQLVDSKRDEILRKMDESMRLMNTKVGIITSDLDSISATIQTHAMNVKNLDNETLPTAQSLKHVTGKLKDLYKMYQRKTTILDSTIDTLHEEIDNVRLDAQRAFKHKTNEFINNLQNEFQHRDVPNPNTPLPSTPYKTAPSHVHPSPYPSQPKKSNTHPFVQSPYQRPTDSVFKGVKMDVLRKLVKISCNDSAQLLDFYTKLRTAMLQAGIYLREIQDISEDEPLYDEQDGYTDSDYRTQGNALYSFLCNEDVIPQDFIFAQNCLKSMSTSMDGFQTLKSMLVPVHPTLNNRRPPNNPPVFSETGDLHLYEQSLRNYFLLHKIYGRSEFNDLDKSKQFIEGLDCNEYEYEKTRLMAILDSVELNSLELTPKHTIQSLATTIMNMSQTKTNNVQINTFQGRTTPLHNKRSTGPYARRQYQNVGDSRSSTEKFSYRPTYGANRIPKNPPKSAAKQKFTKGQCNACKIYGHHIRDCRFIVPHLAMQAFMKNQPQMCKQILDNHISINTEEHKRTIVRTMQTTGLLDDDEESDSYIDMEEIIHTPVVNRVRDADIVDLTDEDHVHE